MSVKAESMGWDVRRSHWLIFLFQGPYSLAFIDEQQRHRDANIEFKTLVAEGLCRACGDGTKWGLSDAGRVLRVLHMLGVKEAGPWTVTQIRQFADMKKLTTDEVVDALDILVEKHIIVQQPTTRTKKWDFK